MPKCTPSPPVTTGLLGHRSHGIRAARKFSGVIVLILSQGPRTKKQLIKMCGTSEPTVMRAIRYARAFVDIQNDGGPGVPGAYSLNGLDADELADSLGSLTLIDLAERNVVTMADAMRIAMEARGAA